MTTPAPKGKLTIPSLRDAKLRLEKATIVCTFQPQKSQPPATIIKTAAPKPISRFLMFNERCQLHQDVYRKLYKQSMPEHQPTPPEPSYGYHTYTKQEAVINVVQATVKGSRERGALIKLMVAEGLVPNKICLYRLIKKAEEGLPIKNEDWGKRGRPRKQQIVDDDWGQRGHPRKKQHQITPQEDNMRHQQHAYDFQIERLLLAKNAVLVKRDNKLTGAKLFSNKEFVRYGVRRRERWKGSLILLAAPVCLSDELELSPDANIRGKNYVSIKQRHHHTRRVKKGPNKHFEYICKPLTSISRPIDICSFIGCRSEKEKKISKLYFNTDTYPGPKNNYWDYDAGDNDTFQSLKFYIEKCARKNGSPVICNGGKDHCKYFVCQNSHDRKKHNASTENGRSDVRQMRCPFTFKVCWDKFGYYIPLLGISYASHNFGCSWHCCK
jgi:hypothetical protein